MPAAERWYNDDIKLSTTSIHIVTSTTSTTPGGTTTTTQGGGGTTTTTFPTGGFFAVNVIAFCTSDNLPAITITFPTNATLAGQSGILDFSDGTSYGVLVYLSGSAPRSPTRPVVRPR